MAPRRPAPAVAFEVGDTDSDIKEVLSRFLDLKFR